MFAPPIGRGPERYRARVADETDVSWWEDYNDGVQLMRETGGRPIVPELSDETCALLGSVDTAFVFTSAGLPPWPNPWLDGHIPEAASFEQVTNPSKFLIVRAIAQARTEVLMARGGARQSAQVEWALTPFDDGGASTSLTSDVADAVPLGTVFEPVDSAHVPSLAFLLVTHR